MKSSSKKKIMFSLILLFLFIFFTVLIKIIDVQAIGPNNSEVGFASLNKAFHDMFSYNESFYKISKILGYLSFLIVGLYGVIGLIQLIKRKSIAKVDRNIINLGAFYVVVLLVYALFEVVVINYRPVLEDGILEASYPSSHTILSICVCIISILVSKEVFKNIKYVKIFNCASFILMFAIIFTRILSGVHWLTDIVGAVLISLFLCMLFSIFINKDKK